MRRPLLRSLGVAFALFTLCASAAEFPLDQGDSRQQCTGMYSKKAWGGSVDPSITLVFPKTPKPETVSLVIFEYNDIGYLGRADNSSKAAYPDKDYICDNKAISHKLCLEKQLGQWLLSKNYNSTTKRGSIYTAAVHLNKSAPIKYPIKRTGYYCVWTHAFDPPELEYKGVVTFTNAYGELAGSQIAKLPFYGGLTIVYALIGALWAFLYWQHRHDILPVQNYITAIILFLILEMLITWAFYDYKNIHGSNALSHALLILVAVLNAGRNSFSFFLLLIVCMGYGVVKPSLGRLMKWVRILAVAHFVFGVVYALASLTVTPDSAGPLVLLVILPLAATLTAFYVWTLNSLKLTMKELAERKQHTKLKMYRRLWFVLLASIFTIFGFFFLNSLTFAGTGSPDFAPTHWKTRWFVLDGWLNLVYLVDLAVVAYLWRPTANNRRFAMSDELAQDEEGGFEIASIGGSELSDDESDEEGAKKEVNGGTSAGTSEVRSAAGSRSSAGVAAVGVTGAAGAALAGTAASAATGIGTVRTSTEEPIFSVGEDGEGWSESGEEESDDEDSDEDDDDEDDDEAERTKLTAKNK